MTEPGEPLIVAPSPVIAAIRFGTWTQFTGIDAADCLLTPMSSIPLLRYRPDYPGGGRRWAGTRAEAMWHPLMWLPERVAARYTLKNPDGSRDVESDELWAIRVGFELTASGLYREDDATWLDVLSLAGLDVADPADLDRVRAWLGGSADPALDEVYLTPLLDAAAADGSRDEDWALHLAEHDIPSLRVISWASSADALLDHCEDITGDVPDSGDDLCGPGPPPSRTWPASPSPGFPPTQPRSRPLQTGCRVANSIGGRDCPGTFRTSRVHPRNCSAARSTPWSAASWNCADSIGHNSS